jgi:pyruvate kinase
MPDEAFLPQKKEVTRHVKIKLDENGKTAELDTIFTGMTDEAIQKEIDKFMQEHDAAQRAFKIQMKVFADSMKSMMPRIDSLKKEIAIVQKNLPKSRIKVFRDKALRDSLLQYRVEVVEGDSMKVFVHKGKNDSDVVVWNGEIHIPPVPPMPKLPPMPPKLTMHGIHFDRYSFDSSDKNIVSYRRKQIGNDREKITIIRKVPKDEKVQEFEFQSEVTR